MNAYKRISSLIAAIILLVTMLPLTVFAETESEAAEQPAEVIAAEETEAAEPAEEETEPEEKAAPALKAAPTSAPTVTTASITGNGVLVKWNAVAGATGYVVYRRAMKAGTTEWTAFARWNNTTSLSFTDTKVYTGTKYQYGIKAYTGSDPNTTTNLGPVGPMSTALVYAQKPAATTKTTTANDADGITISWAKVTGAAGYVIYRRAWSSTTNGWTTFERWNNTTATTFTDTKVYAGTVYQYGIKAYVGNDPKNMACVGAVGPLSTQVRVTRRNILFAGCPEEAYKTIDDLGSYTCTGQVVVRWDTSKLFTGYEMQYCDPSNPDFSNPTTVVISNKAVSSTTISRNACLMPYWVRVRSYTLFNGVKYYGAWSETALCPSDHIGYTYKITEKPACGKYCTVEYTCSTCGWADSSAVYWDHEYVNGHCTMCGKAGEGTVYTSGGSSIYHSSSTCGGKTHHFYMSKQEAINWGYTACPKCW